MSFFASVFVGAVTLSACAFDNVLNNSELLCGRAGQLVDWNLSFEGQERYLRFANEGGVGVVTLLPGLHEVGVKQGDIRLLPGGRYRVGARVRTKGFKAAASGVIVYNYAWVGSVGALGLPADTDGKWVTVEKEIVVPESKNGRYVFTVYAVGMSEGGELSVCDPFLIPCDEAAAAAVVRAPKLSKLNFVTPLKPILSRIPEGDGLMEFAYLGETVRASCEVLTKAQGEADFRSHGSFPVNEGRISARLSGLRLGEGMMKTVLRDASGSVVATADHRIFVVRPLPESASGKRLNALVSRLLTVDAATDGTVGFETPRDGWIWISLDGGTESTSVRLDGGAEPVIRFREGESFETMRKITRGHHELALSSVSGRRLLVNAIPTLMAYTYPAPRFPEYARYAGDFMRTRTHRAINTYSMGYGSSIIPHADLLDLQARGKELYGQANPWTKRNSPDFDIARPEPPAHLAERLKTCPGMVDPFMDGTTFDEIFITDILDKLNYSRALRLLTDAPRPIWTWSSGYTFTQNALNAEYYSSVANASGGEGRLVFECYPYTQATEREMDEYLDGLLGDTMRRADRLMPGAAANAMVVMGMYTCPGAGYCYDYWENVDYKVLSDKYWRMLATDPVFSNLAGAGIYAYRNATEEDLRWTLDVIHHYAIEGRTDSLAERFGFSYATDHLENGFFAKGIDGWRVAKAEDGLVEVRDIPDLAEKTLKFRRCKTNAACVMKRSARAPNGIGRKIVNLKPGRLYCLRFAVVDKKRAFAVRVKMAGCEAVSEDRVDAKDVSVRFVVFRATSSEAAFRISDWVSDENAGAEAGEETAVAAVLVKPYYDR